MEGSGKASLSVDDLESWTIIAIPTDLPSPYRKGNIEIYCKVLSEPTKLIV